MFAVVDNSCARNQGGDLERFLDASTHNRAVLSDVLFMESYKGEPLDNVRRSMAFLMSRAEQVVILRPFCELPMQLGTGSIDPHSLLDIHQSARFSLFGANIESARRGEVEFLGGIRRQGNRSLSVVIRITVTARA